MLYRLEEQLPVDAESLQADFLPPTAGKALGVAVQSDPTKALVDRLAEAGVQVAAICPTPFLTLWQTLRDAPKSLDFVVICQSSSFDVYRLNNLWPIAWYTACSSEEELVRSIEVDLLQNPLNLDEGKALVVGNCDAQLVEALREGVGMSTERAGDSDPLELAARASATLLREGSAGWVDFRKGSLAAGNPWVRLSGLVKVFTLLTLLFFLSLTGVFYLRGRAYSEIACEYRLKEESLFNELHPGQSVPPEVRGNLENEAKRLAAVTGSSLEIPERLSALLLLRQVLGDLPPSLRLRILQIQVTPGGLLIEGQTRSHADAETITLSLKRGGFEMEAPRTEALTAGGVAFTLAGRPSGTAKSVAKVKGGPS